MCAVNLKFDMVRNFLRSQKQTETDCTSFSVFYSQIVLQYNSQPEIDDFSHSFCSLRNFRDLLKWISKVTDSKVCKKVCVPYSIMLSTRFLRDVISTDKHHNWKKKMLSACKIYQSHLELCLHSSI